MTPPRREVKAKAGVETSGPRTPSDATSDSDIRTQDRPAGRRLRGPQRHRALVALALLCGLVLRFGVGLVTQNPDGSTLAWGSALVATGHTNPYQEVVDHPEHDPIPVEQISAVSLAQGPIGVVVGAVPMALANATGLIDIGDQPDGTTFGVGELFAYKVSFLVPEALIVAALWVGAAAMVSGGGRRLDSRRRQLVLLWAVNPLVVFTWGQGMPDTWTVAVACWAALLMGPLADRAGPDRRLRLYQLAALLVPIGAFGTKMMPIVMLVPLAVIVARDADLAGRRRSVGLAAAIGLIVGVAPYVLSQAVRVNVLDRFELNMLNSRLGIPTLHAMPPAHWSLLIAIAVTLWFMTRSDPRRAVIVWMAVSLITVATMSTIIPHLMFWVGAAILMIGLYRPVVGLAMSGAIGMMVFWHLQTYTWLGNLVTAGLDRSRTVSGQPTQWVSQHVPLVPTVGGTISSLWLIVALGGVWLVYRQLPVTISTAQWKALASVGPLMLVAGLGANVVLAEREGPSVWAFGTGGQQVPFELTRDEPWTSTVIDSNAVANTIRFSVDKRTHANPDEIVVEIIDGDENVLASGSVPVWVAEPASEKVAATIALSKRVKLSDVRVRFSRRSVGDGEEVPVVLAGAIDAGGSAAAESTTPTKTDASSSNTTTDSTNTSTTPTGATDANTTTQLEVVNDEGEPSTGNGSDDATAAGQTPEVTAQAQQRIIGPIYRLRDDRARDVPGLVARRLLGPAGLIAWVAAAALAAAGAVLLTRRPTTES